MDTFQEVIKAYYMEILTQANTLLEVENDDTERRELEKIKADMEERLRVIEQ